MKGRAINSARSKRSNIELGSGAPPNSCGRRRNASPAFNVSDLHFSLIDHSDSFANFETPGSVPYLYYTRFNTGLGTLDRVEFFFYGLWIVVEERGHIGIAPEESEGVMLMTCGTRCQCSKKQRPKH